MSAISRIIGRLRTGRFLLGNMPIKARKLPTFWEVVDQLHEDLHKELQRARNDELELELEAEEIVSGLVGIISDGKATRDIEERADRAREFIIRHVLERDDDVGPVLRVPCEYGCGTSVRLPRRICVTCFGPNDEGPEVG